MKITKCAWLEEILNSIKFNNLPHGIIINGSKGVGKNILAKALSEKIISNFEGELSDAHKNLFLKNNHPDFYLLDKEKLLLRDIKRNKQTDWDDEKGFSDVLSFLNLTPSIAKSKVVCMMNADTMNDFAQNALLKSLEEPAPHSYIIMTTSRSRSLAQTIYSRCQVINIPLLSNKEINLWLSSIGIDDHNAIDFPSYTTPFTIVEDIQNDRHNSYKNFITIVVDFILEKIDQSQAIKFLNDLDVSFITKINYLVEFLKILLKSKIINEELSGKYQYFNNIKFSNLKISNIIVDLNNLRYEFYSVPSINESHVFNYFCSELKQSIKQQ
jgi:hypothetical protein